MCSEIVLHVLQNSAYTSVILKMAPQKMEYSSLSDIEDLYQVDQAVSGWQEDK